VSVYYQDEWVTLYHGDCREVELPDALVCSDPPYGISYDADWQTAVHIANGSAPNAATGRIANDEGQISAEFFVRWPRRVVFGFPYLSDPAATGWLVWDKEPGFSGRSLTSPVEMAYSTTWRGFRAIRLLWSGYLRTPGAEVKVGHPTQKPLSVMRQLIGWHDDELILDPFAGSGTTLRAAKDLGRRAVGVELEERYCQFAAERLAQEVLELTA